VIRALPQRLRGALARRWARPALPLVLVLAALAALPFGRAPIVVGQGPENALLMLLPYRLPAAEIPAGYGEYGDSAGTNPALAFVYSADQRRPALQQFLEGGRITGIQQAFSPRFSGPPAIVRLALGLYTDPASAATGVTAITPPDGASVEDLDPPALGDGARFLHVQATDSGGVVTDIFTLAWSRGPLFLGVTLQSQSGDGGQTIAQRFAQAEDAHAAEVGAATAPPAPSTLREDGWRLAVTGALDQAQLPQDAVPASFQRTGSYVWANEQIVLDAGDPAEAVRRVTTYWKRLTGEVEYFTAQDGSRAVLSGIYNVFADAGGAHNGLRDIALAPEERQSVVPLIPPLQLGDETIAYHAVVQWLDGAMRDSYTIEWRRGSVVLMVVANLPQSQAAMPDYLPDAARSLDHQFDSVQLAPRP
jgi:hypothetical protein